MNSQPLATASSRSLRSQGAAKVGPLTKRYQYHKYMRDLLFTIFMLCMATPSLAIADVYQPSHDCSKPDRPFEFEDDWELENFSSEVEDYKQCISDFVDEQNEAIKRHQNAAQEAIDEWNSFVNYELN